LLHDVHSSRPLEGNLCDGGFVPAADGEIEFMMRWVEAHDQRKRCARLFGTDGLIATRTTGGRNHRHRSPIRCRRAHFGIDVGRRTNNSIGLGQFVAKGDVVLAGSTFARRDRSPIWLALAWRAFLIGFCGRCGCLRIHPAERRDEKHDCQGEPFHPHEGQRITASRCSSVAGSTDYRSQIHTRD